jgi:hypothetical protein
MPACLEPIPHGGEGLVDLIAMRTYVLPGDVRTEDLISVAFAVEDQAGLASLVRAAVASRAKKHTKLKWHVKSRELVPGVKRGAGKVMNPEPALPDDFVELVEPNLPAVVRLLGASRDQAALVYAKDERVEQPAVEIVERDVEEDLPAVSGHALLYRAGLAAAWRP